jgi:hypothetical protein
MTITAGQSNIVSTTTSFASGVQVGDLVKIYQPLFANVTLLHRIRSGDPHLHRKLLLTYLSSNNSFLELVIKMDVIHTYRNQAFINQNNGNIIRYYNSEGAYFDTYNAFAVKVCFLSNSLLTIPFMSSARGVAISA